MACRVKEAERDAAIDAAAEKNCDLESFVRHRAGEIARVEVITGGRRSA